MTLQSKHSLAGILTTILAIVIGTATLGYFSYQIHQRNEKMEWQKAPLIQAANANSAAIVALDSRGRISVWNEGATRLFGWSESEMLGQGIDRLADRGVGDMHASAFRASIDAKRPSAREVTCVARKKDKTPMEIHMMVMTYPPQGAVAIIVEESTITRSVASSGKATHR